MIISPFTPLFFHEAKSDGLASDYVQIFAPSDQILIEVFTLPDEECQAGVYDSATKELLFEINWNSWNVNADVKLLFTTLSLSRGGYYIKIGTKQCLPFKVTNDLKNSVLIQYSSDSNRHRKDAIFFVDGMQRFFDFRVHGGFKDANWIFGVDSESFVDSDANVVSLYAKESLQRKFTLGTSRGCPVWLGDLLNRLMCCTYVYIDGERYVRKDASVPEITTVQEGVNSFVFNLTMQKVADGDCATELHNQALLRRIGSDSYRTIDNDTLLIN